MARCELESRDRDARGEGDVNTLSSRDAWEILCRMASLTQRQATAFLRCRVDGLDATAVAMEMECSTRNVRNAVDEAMNLLTREPWTAEERQFIVNRIYQRRRAVENAWHLTRSMLCGPKPSCPPTPIFDERGYLVILNPPWWMRAW